MSAALCIHIYIMEVSLFCIPAPFMLHLSFLFASHECSPSSLFRCPVLTSRDRCRIEQVFYLGVGGQPDSLYRMQLLDVCHVLSLSACAQWTCR